MIKSFVCVCGLLVSLNVVAASLKPVKGKVVDRFNNPLPGATIQVTHSPEKTITDVDGNFNFETIEDAELIVSYIGFRTLKLKTAGENFIHVVLDEDSQLLNDVVVVGYSTNKKVNLSGSVSSLNSEKLASRRVSNVSSALQGMAAGVTVTTQSGEPGGNGGHIRIRGIGTFGGDSAAPLVLVDGVEGTIDEVDPNIIESVSVLKDAASASIYGSRAANGCHSGDYQTGWQVKTSSAYPIKDILDSKAQRCFLKKWMHWNICNWKMWQQVTTDPTCPIVMNI